MSNNYEKNQSLINNVRLINKLTVIKDELERELAEQRNNCDHVSVCLGWDGAYQNSDSSICECLFCRKNAPYTRYSLIDASFYKEVCYGHGESHYNRDRRMNELQDIAMTLYIYDPDISNEEIVKRINSIIRDDSYSCLKNTHTLIKNK